MTDIFLPLNDDDLGIGEKLSQALETHGWSVWPGSKDLYISASLHQLEKQAKTAPATIVIWTPQSRKSSWMRLIAIEAHLKKRLVQVTLGAHPPPSDTLGSPSFVLPENNIETQGKWPLEDALFPELEALCGTPISRAEKMLAAEKTKGMQETASLPGKSEIAPAPPVLRTDPIDTSFTPVQSNDHSHQFRKNTPQKAPIAWWKLSAAAGLVAILMSIPFLIPRQNNLTAPQGQLDKTTSSDQSQTDESSSWMMVDKKSVEALRQFVDHHPSASEVPKAQAILAGLEQDALVEALHEKDAITGLNLLTAFTSTFPDSHHIAESQKHKTELETVLFSSEQLLKQLGYTDSMIAPLSHTQLRNAVEKFEAQLGLPKRGLIDAALVDALNSANDEKERFEKKLLELEASNANNNVDSQDAQASKPPNPSASATIETPPPVSNKPIEASLVDGAANDVTNRPKPKQATQIKTASVSRSTKPAPQKKGTPASPTPKPKTFRDCALCPLMTVIPGGEFRMGDLSGKGDPDERPTRSVNVPSFALGVYEVTFEEWDACIAQGGCKKRPNDMAWGRGARPVMNLAWEDTKPFLKWLSKTTGKTYRLPTEAEWEYAARAGAEGDFTFGDDIADLCLYANGADLTTENYYQWSNKTCSDGVGRITARTGSYEPNAFGLYDMHGNVWEWTQDCWHDSYQGAPTNAEAWTRSCTSKNRVLRGGAFSVKPDNLRSAYRYSFAPKEAMPFFGMRVARDLR